MEDGRKSEHSNAVNNLDTKEGKRLLLTKKNLDKLDDDKDDQSSMDFD